MFLHGNLKECSLPDLLSMLASKAETGRLDINLEESSTAQLYLMNGKPVDCCLGHLQGSEALEALLSSDNGTFRFSSGIVPPNLMFRNGQVRNLAGLAQHIPFTEQSIDDHCLDADTGAEEVGSYDTATPVAPSIFRGGTLVAGLATLALAVGLTIGSVIASIQHSAKTEASVVKSQPRTTLTPTTPPPPPPKVQQRNPPTTSVNTVRRSSSTTFDNPEIPKVKKQTAKAVSIPVVVRIEEGRVVEAYAANPQPGQEAFESTAVRLARQRRFNSQSGTETVFLTISEK